MSGYYSLRVRVIISRKVKKASTALCHKLHCISGIASTGTIQHIGEFLYYKIKSDRMQILMVPITP